VPLLYGIDLAGLNPDIAQARKVAEAMIPVANKDLEKFIDVRIDPKNY